MIIITITIVMITIIIIVIIIMTVIIVIIVTIVKLMIMIEKLIITIIVRHADSCFDDVSRVHHMEHLLFGFMRLPVGHLKTSENSLLFRNVPNTRTLLGLCTSFL